MRMTLKRVKTSLPEYKKVKELYLTAFPPEERPPFFLIMSKTGKRDVDFWSIYADERWVGLAYVISQGDLSYLNYLAVSESERGKGCGSAIMRTLKRMYEGQRLFLALEQLDEASPNNNERIKRRQFYAKNGLKPINFMIQEGSMIYDVMGTSEALCPEEYDKLMTDYFGRLMTAIYPVRALTKQEKERNDNA